MPARTTPTLPLLRAASRDSSDSSSTSDDDSAFIRKQRKHDRERLLNLTGCRARYSKILTREDKDALKDVESFFDTTAHDGSLGAGAAGETTDGTLALLERQKVSDLCFAAQKQRRKRSFEKRYYSYLWSCRGAKAVS